MNMHTCYLIVLLLIFWFQSICGNQNAVLDKNYSDRLTEPHNQQSSLQQINSASYHATVSVKATEPSIKSQTPHHISNLAASKQYENERFRRSSSDDSSGGGSSAETGPVSNSGILPGDMDNDVKTPINFLRLYFCGPGYQNCMYDERFNNIHVQSELLKQIPRMTDISIPTNYLDWKLKQIGLPRNVKDVTRAMGHRDRGFVADEPHYMLVRSDDESPRHMALLSEPELNDPFIPQRGRRQSNAQTYDDPFYPMRGRRAEADSWDDPFFPMRGRRSGSTTWDDPFYPMRGRRSGSSSYDDPFYPMRGRRADKKENPWDDPFVPMRGRKRFSDDGKRAKPQPWDDPFVPMRGRRRPAESTDVDDPFIPMRGRKGDYDDVFIPMRGRRSIQHKDKVTNKKQRRKRNLLASTGTFDAVYTPSQEVIVKLNGGVQDSSSKIVHSLPAIQTLSNHLLNRFEQKTGPIQSIESTDTQSVLNAKHSQQQRHQQQQQQHQKKSYFLLDDFAINPADARDNGLMNDYATDYYVESPSQTSNKNQVHASNNKQRWMKSSKDLSQNRDAGNLARGSGTSLLF